MVPLCPCWTLSEDQALVLQTCFNIAGQCFVACSMISPPLKAHHWVVDMTHMKEMPNLPTNFHFIFPHSFFRPEISNADVEKTVFAPNYSTVVRT
jgi:hypothetical protein